MQEANEALEKSRQVLRTVEAANDNPEKEPDNRIGNDRTETKNEPNPEQDTTPEIRNANELKTNVRVDGENTKIRNLTWIPCGSFRSKMRTRFNMPFEKEDLFSLANRDVQPNLHTSTNISSIKKSKARRRRRRSLEPRESKE